MLSLGMLYSVYSYRTRGLLTLFLQNQHLSQLDQRGLRSHCTVPTIYCKPLEVLIADLVVTDTNKNIRRGGFIAAIVGICMLPWNLLKSSNNFTSYLSAYSVFLSSIAGVMVSWLPSQLSTGIQTVIPDLRLLPDP